MILRALGIAMILAAAGGVPALAGGECASHAKGEPAATAAKTTHAGAASSAACAEALALARRTVTEVDGGVSIEFYAKDRAVLDEIVRLANEGRIFGDGTPDTTVPRRIRRDGRTVTLTVEGRSGDELSRIRSVAATLGTPNPECGERLATTAPSAREG